MEVKCLLLSGQMLSDACLGGSMAETYACNMTLKTYTGWFSVHSRGIMGRVSTIVAGFEQYCPQMMRCIATIPLAFAGQGHTEGMCPVELGRDKCKSVS